MTIKAAIDYAKQNADLIEDLQRDVKTATKNLADFASKLSTALELLANGSRPKFEPNHHMSWSDGNFTNAAEIDTSNAVIHWLERGSLDSAIEQLQKRVLSGAMHPERSSSPVSNIMGERMLQGWACLFDRLTNHRTYRDAREQDAS